jgi:integrase
VATVRERRPGVWEVRVFTGRGDDGRPTQVSKTVRGTKRDARRVAAQLESQPVSNAAGRTVVEVLDAWREVNAGVWSESSKRDYASRAAFVAEDGIGCVAIARLGVGDVERWHARMRRSGVGDSAIRTRHSVLRAALAQAVRWGWVGTNVASSARLRHAKRQPRESMSAEEVRSVIAAAQSIDPAAGLALRLAAVAGARRSELAALRWSDFAKDSSRLRIDSSVTVIRSPEGDEPELVDAPTKTADGRVVRLDGVTIAEFETQRTERAEISPYLFSMTLGPPNPDRIGWWWKRARELSGIDRKWRLHDLRHWTATTAITNGHDVRTVAGRLGHANAAMTLRVYAHAIEAADEQLAETLGAALDDSASAHP